MILKFASLFLASLGLLLAGCETMGGSVSSPSLKERWAARTSGRKCVYRADARTVHAAAVVAAKSMGFRIVKTGPAQGIIDAVNRLHSDSSFRGGSQLQMKVRIGYAAEGCELQLFLSDLIEEDNDKGPGRVTETPLVDSPLYELFFRTVEANLKPAPAPDKNEAAH